MLNGMKIADLDALSSHLQGKYPGQTVAVQFMRTGQMKTVDLVLGMRHPLP